MKKLILLLALLGLALCACAREYNVLDYGAVGDKKTDCTVAFQKAIDECYENKGGTVVVPTGEYMVKGCLEVKDGVLLKGTYEAPPTNDGSNKPNAAGNMKGSIIAAYGGKNDPDGPAFLNLTGNNSGVEGFIIHYPEWSQKTVPPIPYSPCIGSKGGSNHSVQNVNLLNAYVGISFYACDRMTIRGIHGYPIKKGISIDLCGDICRIENCHFWPFNMWYSTEDPYCVWINKNGTAFDFGRTDWQSVMNTFCFGYGTGYRFANYGTGGSNGSFVGIGADSCTNAVVVEDIHPMGLAITNGEFVGRWNSRDSCQVVIRNKAAGKVSLLNCAFWGPNTTCIRCDSDKARLSVIGCTFESWDENGEKQGAITLNRGVGIINSNTFADNTRHIVIGKQAKGAVITGNYSENFLSVQNGIGKLARIADNIPEPYEFTRENYANYNLKFNGEKDKSYISGFIYAEPTRGGSRWSSKGAAIELPGNPGETYTVSFRVDVVKAAMMESAGIYVGDKNLMPFTGEGSFVFKNKVKMPKEGKITFTVKCKNWVPHELDETNPDTRVLGVAFMEANMVSDPKARTFSMNTLSY